ncbi:MAG: 4-alpha-glucanotransferase [Rhodobacteraceae bacterium]|nr:4-alpha-glucanotransferase [Paracoccaceae bacterium]
MTATRRALERRLGILGSYTDQMGGRRRTSAATRDALLAAMGCDVTSEAALAERLEQEAAPRSVPHWHICTIGVAPTLAIPDGQRWTLTQEDGATQSGVGALPALPLGIHRLECGPERCWLLSAPDRLPAPPRGWGVTLPLYGLRGAGRGGLATYEDLAETAEALAELGASFVGINPVHAGFGADPRAISPYSPSHRRRHATLHLDVPETTVGPPGDLIDYPAALKKRRAAAERAFAEFSFSPDFDEFVGREWQSLVRFTTYEALAEIHGAYWNTWPEALQTPGSDAVARFAAENADRLRFHTWLQFKADAQLAEADARARAAGMTHGLYLDLAVGTHPFGAETWAERESFAFGVSLGAPPDAFSANGQSWNLAPFNPHALIASGFAPLQATLQAQLRHARLLRIDHILGFERAFWVPQNGAPGAYVAMPRDAMLAVVRIEAARVGATIVGEDLGNIPRGLRGGLDGSGILGCRVAMFEAGRQAGAYPIGALTSFGTHDLPTWLGWREGRDIDARLAIGGIDAGTAKTARVDRAVDVAKFDAAIGTENPAADDMHRFLASTPSSLIALQADDILGVRDQPNLPGTTEEYPNWRRQLPVAGADLAKDARFLRIATLMKAANR